MGTYLVKICKSVAVHIKRNTAVVLKGFLSRLPDIYERALLKEPDQDKRHKIGCKVGGSDAS